MFFVEMPLVVDLSLDYRVLGFTLLLSLGTGILFGLAPALRATRVDLVPELRSEGSASFTGRQTRCRNPSPTRYTTRPRSSLASEAWKLACSSRGTTSVS